MMMMIMMIMMIMIVEITITNDEYLIAMIDDATMDTCFDDFAKRDGPTDLRTYGQTQRHIEMRWTHLITQAQKKRERERD